MTTMYTSNNYVWLSKNQKVSFNMVELYRLCKYAQDYQLDFGNIDYSPLMKTSIDIVDNHIEDFISFENYRCFNILNKEEEQAVIDHAVKVVVACFHIISSGVCKYWIDPTNVIKRMDIKKEFKSEKSEGKTLSVFRKLVDIAATLKDKNVKDMEVGIKVLEHGLVSTFGFTLDADWLIAGILGESEKRSDDWIDAKVEVKKAGKVPVRPPAQKKGSRGLMVSNREELKEWDVLYSRTHDHNGLPKGDKKKK